MYNPYQADFIWLGSNFIVCDIQSRASKAVDGVVVVPFKNLYKNNAGAVNANVGAASQDSGILKGWRVWIINVAPKNNNVHAFVSVFGADRYMHTMTAMTKNRATYNADWWKDIALPGAD